MIRVPKGKMIRDSFDIANLPRIVVDDGLSNSDWIKANTNDPTITKEQVIEQERAAGKTDAEIYELPIMGSRIADK